MHLLRRAANPSLFLHRWAPRAAQRLSPIRHPRPPQFGLSAFPISRTFATHSMATTPSQAFSSPDLPKKFGNFDLIRTEKLGLADIVVSKYRSRETGLTVVHLDYEGTWSNYPMGATVPILSDTSAPSKWLLCCANRKYVSILGR